MNKAAVDTHEQFAAPTGVFIALGHTATQLGVELLGHVVSLCLPFKENAKLFANWMFHFTFPPINVRIQFSPHPCQHLYLSLFTITILADVTWYFILALPCASLMMLRIFPRTC